MKQRDNWRQNVFIPLVLKKAVGVIWGDTPSHVRYYEASGEVTQGEFSETAAHHAARRALYMTHLI